MRRVDTMTAEIESKPTETVPPKTDERGPMSRVSPWLVMILRPVHWAITHFYFHVEIVGRENLPVSGPVLVAPTHRSRWDTLGLYAMNPNRPMRFLTAIAEFAGVQGWFIRRLGAIPVNPARPTAGALRHCRDLLLAGEPLVIFPEGRLLYIPPDHVGELRPGTAWLALDCQARLPEVPLSIVPVRLNYSDRILGFRSRIRVIIREPIALAPYLEFPRKEGIARLTADLQAALGDEVDLSDGEPPKA